MATIEAQEDLSAFGKTDLVRIINDEEDEWRQRRIDAVRALLRHFGPTLNTSVVVGILDTAMDGIESLHRTIAMKDAAFGAEAIKRIAAEEDRNDWKRQCGDLSVRLQDVCSERDQLDGKLSIATGKLDEKMADNEKLEVQIADMVKINDNLLEDNKALAGINESVTSENKRLTVDLDDARRMTEQHRHFADDDRRLAAKAINEQAATVAELSSVRSALDAMQAERNHLMQVLDEERAGHAATKEEAKKKDDRNDLIINGLKKEHDRLAVTQEHLIRLENRVAEVQRVVSKPIRIVKGKNAERLWGCKRCGCVFKSQKKANRCECA